MRISANGLRNWLQEKQEDNNKNDFDFVSGCLLILLPVTSIEPRWICQMYKYATKYESFSDTAQTPYDFSQCTRQIEIYTANGG